MHWSKILRMLQNVLMDEREMRELVTLRWFLTLKGTKLPPPFGKIRVNSDDLCGNLFRWVRAIFQSVDF